MDHIFTRGKTLFISTGFITHTSAVQHSDKTHPTKKDVTMYPRKDFDTTGTKYSLLRKGFSLLGIYHTGHTK